MPPPKGNNFKNINHRDTMYRWILRGRQGTNEMVIEATAPVNGQTLLAELPKVVSIRMVTDGIDFALANGWKPNESGPPFRLKMAHKRFELVKPEA